MMPSLVAWWKPIVVDLSVSCAICIGILREDKLALSKMSCKVGTTGKQRPLAMFVAEFALKPFRLVLFVFVPFEIRSTRTFMTTNIARKDLLL